MLTTLVLTIVAMMIVQALNVDRFCLMQKNIDTLYRLNGELRKELLVERARREGVLRSWLSSDASAGGRGA